MRLIKFGLALASIALAAAGTAVASAQDDVSASAIAEALGMKPLRGKKLAAVQAEAARHPLGSRENPVLAEMPAGERAYLDRLRCKNGAAPAYDRAGSMGPGIYGSIVDLYELECADGTRAEVVIDMYHPDHIETAAVPGFTIVAP